MVKTNYVTGSHLSSSDRQLFRFIGGDNRDPDSNFALKRSLMFAIPLAGITNTVSRESDCF